MTQIESAMFNALADVAKLTTEIGKEQAKIANFIVQHPPNLSEAEKQEMLAAASSSWHSQQQLQDLASKLKALL